MLLRLCVEVAKLVSGFVHIVHILLKCITRKLFFTKKKKTGIKNLILFRISQGNG